METLTIANYILLVITVQLIASQKADLTNASHV